MTENILMIGYTERTTEQAIEEAAHRLLVAERLVREIIVVQIPAKREYMHLDTVLTMVDYDKFLLYPGIKDKIYCYRLTPGKDGYVSCQTEGPLKETLTRTLKRPISIIYSGGDNPITAAREQWGDSTNTLAVAPGKVAVYNRNQVTNEILLKNGVDVCEFEGSELVRGRGGPRCMSLPLERAPVL